MKNRTRIIILTLLLVANVLFVVFTKTKGGVSFNEDLFVAADTAAISTVKISSGSDQVVLNETEQNWQVNDQYPADQGLIRVLFSILHRIQVKKPVDVERQNVIEVEVTGDDAIRFSVWGNPTKTRTFFSLAGSGQAYEVVIPGYNEYVGGIFELNADQWRDRLLMHESWRTIQQLTLNYRRSDDSDLSIHFEKDFFRVDKVHQMDSSALIDYLNQFQYFEVNEWIRSGRFSRYDSLATTSPMATLTIESINSELPAILHIYPRMSSDQFHLLVDQHNNMMAVDLKRTSNILRKPDHFRQSE